MNTADLTTFSSWSNRCRFASKLALLLLVALASLPQTIAQETTPERGFRPAGSYANSGIEAISTTSGNMMLTVPLAALPPGRGGLSASLNLIYNSKLYDTFPTGVQINQSYYDVTNLKKSQSGGWRYGYEYSLYAEGKYGGTDQMGEINPCESSSYIAKLALLTPDGGKHDLRLTGHTDGDGFHNVWQDGRPACFGGTSESGTLVYYTTDGTFLRLEVEHDSDSNLLNNPWTLFLANGGRVTGGNSPQRIHDRNNNYIEIVEGTYNSHTATYLNDQVGRSIIIEYESATNQDTIHVTGYDGAALTTIVAWTGLLVNKAYTRDVGAPFSFSAPFHVVSQITLPSQADSLYYSFGYNANGTSDPDVGWGELNSVTLPSGAKATYTYVHDNQTNIYVDDVLLNRPNKKQLVYRPEYDVSSVSNTPCNISNETCVTETTTYSFEYVDTGDAKIPVKSIVTGPDGGVSTQYFNRGENGGVDLSGSALVYKSVGPDGTVTERYWQQNIPYATPAFSETFYPKYEFTSLPTSSGTLTVTAIKEYNYDKNGNVTRVAVYDWVLYGNVPRNSESRPYGVPSGASPTTVSVNTFYNPTPDASNTTTNDSDSFHRSGSPRLLRLLESSEVQNSSSATYARTEVSYDYTATTGIVSYAIGNPTLKRSWDSTKGSVSNPLTSGNSISTSAAYNTTYGNPTSTTDANGNQTTFTYGAINGHSDLYPTVTKVAYGTSVQRHTTAVYDYYTGVVKEAKDEDNNVSTVTDYDALGRRTLVEHANGKDEETQTETFYSDANRRVIMRSDLAAVGDEKLVSIQHFDQLGRIRLARQLEDSTTQSATTEADGVKVQTRYIVSNPCQPDNEPSCLATYAAALGSYQVTSNPYRTTSDSTVGWTRSRNDVGGRVIEVKTFEGSGLPGPWGSNSTGTGTMTTVFNAQLTTGTDQAGKVRRSVINGLGQLARVDEPDASGNLDSGASPVQPTSYGYDPLSNLTLVVQDSQTRTFAYSSLSRLNSVTNPESGTISYSYDNNGNLLVRTDARSVSTHLSYDALNRPVRRWYNSSSSLSSTTNNSPALPSGVGASEEADYYYDSQSLPSGAPSFSRGFAAGRLVAATYGNGSTGDYYAYDALGRATLKTQQIGGLNYQVQRSYNRASGVTTQTYPSGRTVSYTYDGAGRTSGFSGYLGDGTQRTYATGVIYSPLGGMEKEQFGTDTAIYNKLYYNSRGQLSEIRVSTSYTGATDTNRNRGSIINNFSEQCSQGSGVSCVGTNNNGNVSSQQVFIPHDDAISASTSWYQKFSYDSLNRLSWAKEYNSSDTQLWRQEFEYDRWGNRTIHQTNTTGTGINKKKFSVNDANNRLGVGSGETGTMSYDSAGNLTTDTFTGAGNRTYDAENHITAAATSGSGASYVYDADGRRVIRNVDGAVTWQVYGLDSELLGEYSANVSAADPQKEYGYRNGQLLVTADAPVLTNLALSANGGTASASSAYSGWAASATNNGDRKGLGAWSNGIWSTASAGFPAWLQIDFNGNKVVSEIDVFTEQDNYTSPSEPTETMTFSTWGLTGYDVQYWNGSSWTTVTSGSITSNNKVWRKFNFSAITTTKIRVLATASPDNFSRLTEVEAWGYSSGSGTNVSLASNGAIATASSVYGAGYGASAVTNGDRKGLNAGSNGNWNDAAPANTFPDWVEVAFNGAKIINEINVFTLQDNWSSPSEPTESMTFSLYGLTAYDVQYWNGSSWTTVPGGSVTGNNKVWRKFTFSPITTTKIRVHTSASPDGWSRLTEIEAWEDPNSSATVNWLVADHLGTPRIVVDETGLLSGVKRHDYLPFGEELYATVGGRTSGLGYGGDTIRQKFTGYERDNESGLDFARARYYASVQGRFTSVDPLMASAQVTGPQSWNRYSYVLNRPTNMIDPSGLEPSNGGCAAEFSRCDGQDERSRAEREYEKRITATLDGLQASHYLSEGDYEGAQRIFNNNEDVGLEQGGTVLWGEFAATFTEGYAEGASQVMASSNPWDAMSIVTKAWAERGWKAVYKKMSKIRGPDFKILNISLVAGITRFIARGDDMSTALQGMTASKLEGTFSVGWMIQRATPSNQDIRTWGSGLSFSTGAFSGVGGGFLLSAGNPSTPGVYIGVGTGAGQGASFNYEVW